MTLRADILDFDIEGVQRIVEGDDFDHLTDNRSWLPTDPQSYPDQNSEHDR